MDKYSVLIIDDNEVDRYILKRTLNKTGVVNKVFEENHGGAALEFINEYEKNKQKFQGDFPPLVFFLDINMPLVGGFEFLEKFEVIRKKLQLNHVTIMMLSSSARTEDKERAFSYSFVKEFISKGSVTTEELKSKIMKCAVT